MNVIVLIPALEPNEKLICFAKELTELFSPRIIVVNDGSGNEANHTFETLKQSGCDVLTHNVNKGKGAALKTGMAYAAKTYSDADGIVTADSDGQHSPNDVFRIVKLITDNTRGIILGTRCFEKKDVPLRSILGNKITSGVFYLKTGCKLYDTQTGLRGIPMELVPEMLTVGGTRFEYEMNVLLYAVKNNIRLVSLPINTIYEEKHSSHFRTVRDAARIYYDILKFGFSSAICAGIDFGLFIAFTVFFFGAGKIGIVLSTVSARVISGICNFLINKYIVFGGKNRNELFKYFALFLVQMLLSAELTAFLSDFFPNAPVAKLIVDIALFTASFFVQKRFIFKKEVVTDDEKEQ